MVSKYVQHDTLSHEPLVRQYLAQLVEFGFGCLFVDRARQVAERDDFFAFNDQVRHQRSA